MFHTKPRPSSAAPPDLRALLNEDLRALLNELQALSRILPGADPSEDAKVQPDARIMTEA